MDKYKILLLNMYNIELMESISPSFSGSSNFNLFGMSPFHRYQAPYVAEQSKSQPNYQQQQQPKQARASYNAVNEGDANDNLSKSSFLSRVHLFNF